MGQILITKIQKHPAAIEKLHNKIHISTLYFVKRRTDLYVYHLKEPFELSPYQILMDSVRNTI